MHNKRTVWLGGVAALVVAALVIGYNWRGASKATASDLSVAVTPPGVTLTVLGNPGDQDGVTRVRAIKDFLLNGPTAFSDANGMTFYTYDRDTTTGKSACAGECLKLWRPA